MADKRRKTVVVVGNGMVGHRFCERLVEFDADHAYRIVTFCEEPRPAYDRVHLTKYFEHRQAEKLALAAPDWHQQNGIDLYVGDRATEIDRARRVVRSARGREIAYDAVVLATGSAPFVPPVPGIDKKGVFVYRTIEDLEKIIAYGQAIRKAAVIGGGLLGLEAAKAAYDLGLETHVVEFAPRLMPRQIDETGSRVLVGKINALGVQVHLNKNTKEILGNGKVEGMAFADGGQLDVKMIVVSAGIKPRDDLARGCGLNVGQRGGVVVDDSLRTSDPDIYAIGEVALYGGMIYGLVAPGYEMAEIAAANLLGQSRAFKGADMSTKLKLMGVDVASFGDAFADAPSPPSPLPRGERGEKARAITCEDPFKGSYKKLLFNLDGTRLLGGILVGDAAEYGTLSMLAKSDEPLAMPPNELLFGKVGETKSAGGIIASIPNDAQVCSCNNVTKGQICDAVRDKNLTSVEEIKLCTRAGTGCSGCLPLVTDLFKAQIKASGKKVSNALCEHFSCTRQELFEIIKIKHIKTFDEAIRLHGHGQGCEICKPALASILASLWNENVNDHATIQDTNDRFLANLQRGGSYSVVPRVPGGEITPEKLIVLGRVAKKYGLYTKITGGQRIDLFGAALHQLPDIWEELVGAGFESGHAYGKALRTVKSCVGTTWCRYGVQDSVGFAIRVENRYKGVRSPHKVKAAVSGCVRECAEAQGKDFGVIATEKGWNLYVCGNGGAKPRHADLLAADIDDETCIRYIDRFLMYYIQTADRLTRTSVWLEKMEGGIDHLRDVIVHDSLGVCDELERQMQFLVDSYKCEWKEVVNDPERRRKFQQFVNTDETEPTIEFVSQREQKRPADWATHFMPISELTVRDADRRAGGVSPLMDKVQASGDEASGDQGADAPPLPAEWVHVGKVWDFPADGGAAIKYGRTQIAVFNFASRGEWYSTQNMCPHRREFVLSRGMIGDQNGKPKVACPVHKRTYSLESGQCLSGDDYAVQVFPVRIDGDDVYLLLPPMEALDAVLATDQTCNGSCHSPPEGKSSAKKFRKAKVPGLLPADPYAETL
ncbi:MAG TPA: nitrite reductase large subunit NirB [Gemmataceae bacterium]|nr:nitrite reductase large subunit NirB [Gemmataceae bacterium]